MFVCEQENSKRCRQFLIKKNFGGVGSVTKGTADYISVVVFFVFFYFLYFWFLHFFLLFRWFMVASSTGCAFLVTVE